VELLQVTGRARQFFGNVTSICENGDLLHQSLIVERDRHTGIGQTLAELFSIVLDDLRRKPLNGHQQRGERLKSRRHVRFEV
jgi:hypothetical protein